MPPSTIKLLGIQAGAGGRTGGTEDGPVVLRELGLVRRLTAAGHTVEDLGNIPGVYETRVARGKGRSVNAFRKVLQFNRHTHAAVLGTLRQSPDAFLLVLGGDHSLAIGTLAGLSGACKRLGLLWMDAHPDFNTPGTSPSGNIHGMSLAVVCGRGQPDLRQIAARDPVLAEEDVWLLGCRDIDAGERSELADSAVHVLRMDEWRKRGLIDAALDSCRQLAARCDRVHLSFDIDVLDAKFVRGTGTPVPNGLTPDEATSVLRALGGQGVVSSAEFVEYNPRLDGDRATGQLTISLVESLLFPQ